VAGFMGDQLPIRIDKPPCWNRENAILLCKATLSFLPTINLLPRDVIFLEVVSQPGFIRIKVNADDIGEFSFGF